MDFSKASQKPYNDFPLHRLIMYILTNYRKQQVTVYNDRLILSKEKFDDNSNDVTIYFKDIHSVIFKKPFIFDGYIEFITKENLKQYERFASLMVLLPFNLMSLPFENKFVFEAEIAPQAYQIYAYIKSKSEKSFP